MKIIRSDIDQNEYSLSVSGIEKIKRSVGGVPFGTGEIANQKVANDFLDKARIEFPSLVGGIYEDQKLLEKYFQ